MWVPRVRRPPGAAGPELELGPAEARHLATVLRRQPGDRVELLGQTGGALAAEIVAMGESHGEPWVRVRVLEGALPRTAAVVPWTIGLGLVKGDAIDLAVRMAAELGLARIVPLVTERSLPAPRRGGSKEDRWERIAAEAAKQCGRTLPLRVDRCRGLDDLLREGDAATGAGPPAPRWIAVPGGPDPGEALLGPGAGRAEAVFLVGPEGGFAPSPGRCVDPPDGLAPHPVVR